MRNTPFGRRSSRVVHLALVASMLAVVTPTIGSSHIASASGDDPILWSASGPATVTPESMTAITSTR